MDDAVLDYHELSKHRFERYAPGPGRLDWATQPDPFRTYAGCERVELPLLADALPTRFNDVRAGRLPAAVALDRDALATLLELSLGLSAWKSHRGASWALRCNPSSGNLHPTEGYVVCDAMPGLDAGVYHYVSRDHALERRARLAAPPRFGSGMVVGLSSIYWREAWKYGARAFRYCAHDCGHAIAAVAYAAAALGLRTRQFADPGDADVARLLGLDRDRDFDGAEREAPDCLLWVGTGGPPTVDALVGAVDGAQWSGAANALSPAHVEWRQIDRVHAATVRPRTPLAPRFAPRVAPPGGPPDRAATRARPPRRGHHPPAAERGRFRRRDGDRRRGVLRDARAARAARRRPAVGCLAPRAARAPRAPRAPGRRPRA